MRPEPPISTLFPYTTLFRSMAAAVELLRAARPGDDGVLILDGEPLTAERVKAAIDAEYARRDAMTDAILVAPGAQGAVGRSEEHTSELPSRQYLVCRLLLEH